VTKSKTIAAALAALAIAATSGAAQDRPRVSAAAVSNANANSAYMVDHGYDECRFVDRIDRRGNVLTIKICDVIPY
jgi:hypothetical protein